MTTQDTTRAALSALSTTVRAAEAAFGSQSAVRFKLPVNAGLAGVAAILDGIVELLESHSVAEVQAMVLELSRQPARRADFGSLADDVEEALEAREDAPADDEDDDDDDVPANTDGDAVTENDE